MPATPTRRAAVARARGHHGAAPPTTRSTYGCPRPPQSAATTRRLATDSTTPAAAPPTTADTAEPSPTSDEYVLLLHSPVEITLGLNGLTPCSARVRTRKVRKTIF